MKVKAIENDTVKIGENVRMIEQIVKCNSCGAIYTIETYLDRGPTVSKEMLARLDNIVHP